MIEVKLKLESFLRKLALHITGEARAEFVPGEDVWYLGAGYWRAQLIERDGDKFIALINPSMTAEKIAKVEAAMAILV